MSIKGTAESVRAVTRSQWDGQRRDTGLIAGLQARLRFFLLLLPRVLVRRCTAVRAALHAAELTRSGSHGLGKWCWERAIRTARDEDSCDRTLDLCIGTGHHEKAVALANRYYDDNGMMLAAAVRLTGMLVLHGGFNAAHEVYNRLVRACRGTPVGCWPAPAWPRPPSEDELRTMLASYRVGADAETSAFPIDLNVARLCFSFGIFHISASLFERASDRGELHVEDRIAHAYSLLRSETADQVCQAADVPTVLPGNLSKDADWQILLATVMFARVKRGDASELAETAMRARFATHPDVEQIVVDCRRIVTCIMSCSDTLAFDAEPPAGPSSHDHEGLRKIFICGNGWSGSGALYDALTEYDGFAEAPDTPIDRYVNPCTGNEMMLVQGAAGLGTLWRKAREEGALSRLDLWELFRCHVLGGGAIGFTEHKGAKTALDLVARMGARYTQIFRELFESLTALPADAPLEQFRCILIAATEAFASLLANGRKNVWIVFNNAVFGSNVDMLEIFSNFRAAVVARDPLDQFADRRNQDLKHWMSASRFVPVYRGSRQAFLARRQQLKPERAKEVREVEFERFVQNEGYRSSIIDWLLQGRNAQRVCKRFEPHNSASNIGVHGNLLTQRERNVIEQELAQWRRR